MPSLCHHYRRRLTGSISALPPRTVDRALLPGLRRLAENLVTRSDSELAQMVLHLREAVTPGGQLAKPERLATSFALTFEAVRRTTGCSYYDVQLLAGLALARGAVVEMKTGEGKTLVAALPAAFHALTGEGVHVATVNRYLAERDFELLRNPLSLLGFTVGLVTEGSSPDVKRSAYRCDITYSTGYEFGFDFLRDQLSFRICPRLPLGESWRRSLRGEEAGVPAPMQRGHAFAIIDEVDSVLIDEANTPLVLSQGERVEPEARQVYAAADQVAETLVPDVHFRLDRRQCTVTLTADGLRSIYGDAARIPRTGLCRPWATYVEQALRSRHLFRQDVDYVIQDGKVLLVDQYTGRIFADRHWRDGLHQAVEFRAGVQVTAEKQPLARVSRQRYFSLYRTLCGMSGTCVGCEAEFHEFYRLPVVVIPERRPNRRRQLPTRYFAESSTKWAAIVQDIARRRETGQPVLVGTATIEESQQLSQRLNHLGIAHRVLNGLQDEQEAALVATAGGMGAVTIATNMAGRGTDIPLASGALECGGLHVLATQRQESARVDRQLMGRAARQGEPGSCQLFVAADDRLFDEYGRAERRKIAVCCQHGVDAGAALDRWTDRVQRRAERANWMARRELLAQDAAWQEMLVLLAGPPDGAPVSAQEVR